MPTSYEIVYIYTYIFCMISKEVLYIVIYQVFLLDPNNFQTDWFEL